MERLRIDGRCLLRRLLGSTHKGAVWSCVPVGDGHYEYMQGPTCMIAKFVQVPGKWSPFPRLRDLLFASAALFCFGTKIGPHTEQMCMVLHRGPVSLVQWSSI
eukprot:6874603-Pyramimonas_sp.AAC.1